MNETLTKLIVHELGELRSRNDIIQDVCVQGRLQWPEAELLVTLVEAEKAHAIVRKQTPWLIAISIGLVIGGLLQVAPLLYALGLVMGLFPFPGIPPVEIEMPLSTRALMSSLGEMVAGFGMIAGGIVGLHETYLKYFET